MKKILYLFLLQPIVGLTQGPFSYWEYQIGPINESQIQWDLSHPGNFTWQYGYHHKPFFGDSTNKILITDTSNMYQTNTDASVDLILTRPYEGDYVELGTAYVLKFDHKIDTDSNAAGGYFEINVDGDSLPYIKNGDTLNTFWLKFYLQAGQSLNIPNDMEASGYNMIADNGDTITLEHTHGWTFFYHDIHGYHDTLFDDVVGFTGTYSDWQPFYTEMFFWQGGVKLADQQDSLTFRFHFKSDNTSSGKNGWAIRDIQSGYAVHPTGSIQEVNKNQISVFPSPAKEQIHFVNLKNDFTEQMIITVFDVNGTIQTSTLFSNSLSLDVSELSSGLYFYQISSSNDHKIQSGKFIRH